MLSYQEKRLLAVQKYLIDESNSFADELVQLGDSFKNKVPTHYYFSDRPRFDSFDELADYAQSLNYDLFIRPEDILSAEELDRLEREYKDIEKEFAKITGLNKNDCKFVIAATALQVARQII